MAVSITTTVNTGTCAGGGSNMPLTDEQCIEIASKYLSKHNLPHGRLWKIERHSGRVTVWFWRASESMVTNPYVTMNLDGRYAQGSG